MKIHAKITLSYVFSYGNKYVQYRLMKATWTTAKSYWQGVDEEPIINSKNLIESSGAFNGIKQEFENICKIASINQLKEDTSYRIGSTGDFYNSNASTKIVFFEVGANTKFVVRGTCGIKAATCAITSGTNSYTISPYERLQVNNEPYGEFYYSGVTDNRRYIAITVDNETDYVCYTYKTISDLSSEINNDFQLLNTQISSINSEMEVGDYITPVRTYDDYTLGTNESGDVVVSATGKSVIVYNVGANKKFKVGGTLNNKQTKCAILSGRFPSDFKPWNILLKNSDNGTFEYSGTTDTRSYIAISIDSNTTDYYCKEIKDFSNTFEALRNEVASMDKRTVVNIKTTDTQTEILTKLINAYQQDNCDVYFEHGTYTFDDVYVYMRDTLEWAWTMELPIGGGCKYYLNGSTLISNPPSSTYETSRNLFGCKAGQSIWKNTNFELYDGILINNGGTYCVHDECLYASVPYTHKYVNMRMYYNTVEGITPEYLVKCIGGGSGRNGIIIIENSVFVNNYSGAVDTVSWHGLDDQGNNANMNFFVTGNYFNKRFRVSGFESGDSLFAKYSGNEHGTAPNIDGGEGTSEIYIFDNDLVS